MTKNGVVDGVKVSNQEGDVFNTKHVDGTELYKQRNLIEGLRCPAWDDPPEWRVNGGEVLLGQAQLHQGASEEDIEGTPSIDEDLSEAHLLDDVI